MTSTRNQYQITSYIAAGIIAGVMSWFESVNALEMGAHQPHIAAIWVFNYFGLLLFVLGGGIAEKNKTASILVFWFAMAIRVATFVYIGYQQSTGLFNAIEIGILFGLNGLILFFEILLYFWNDAKDLSKEDKSQQSEYIYQAQEFRFVFVQIARMVGVKVRTDIEAHTARGWLPLIEENLERMNREAMERLEEEIGTHKETIDILRKELEKVKASEKKLRKDNEKLEHPAFAWKKIEGSVLKMQRKGAHYLTVDGEGIIWSVDKETGRVKGEPGKVNGRMVVFE